MAITITYQNSSAYSVEYLCVSDGTSTANITSTGAATPDFATDMTDQRYALYDLLVASYASQAAARTPFTNGTASILLTPRDSNGLWYVDENVSGTDLIMTVGVQGASASTCVLTVKYNHTFIR